MNFKSNNFKKIAFRFNEESLNFILDESKMSYLGDLSYSNRFFKDIDIKCNYFQNFKELIRFKNRILTSIYLIFPIVFIFTIIGFESGYDAFGLAWFFIAFLFGYFLICGLIFFLISTQMYENFNRYSLYMQEIINKYNLEYFIRNNIYASFRFQNFDSKGKIDIIKNILNPFQKSYSMTKSKQGNNNDACFILKTIFKSELIKLLKIKFWIEFLVKNENLENLKSDDIDIKIDKIYDENDDAKESAKKEGRFHVKGEIEENVHLKVNYK